MGKDMSTLVNHLLCPNFEDYDKYDEVSCTLKTWPDMWEPEIRAEAGVYEELQKLRQQIFFMARDSVQRTIMHFKRMKAKPSYITELARKALLQLAEEYGWKVKNYDSMKYCQVSPIIRTSLGQYEDDSMDVDIEVFIKPKQEQHPTELIEQYMTKRERIHFEGKQQFPEKDKKNVVAYALVELAAENGWQQTMPCGHMGRLESDVFRI